MQDGSAKQTLHTLKYILVLVFVVFFRGHLVETLDFSGFRRLGIMVPGGPC